MSLTQLPPELLGQVLSDRDLRKRDLANLARVNKNIHVLVLNIIYRDVSLHGSGQHSDQEIFDLFHRTVIATPRLAAITHSLTISAFLPDDDKILRSRQILAKLTALRNLSLAFHGKGYFDANFIQKIMPTEFDTGAVTLAKLQDIKITDPGLSFREILNLICLPSLVRLAVKCHRKEGAVGEDVSPSTSMSPSSNCLKKLTLTISMNYNHGLQQVLSASSALESLICNISSMHNINDNPVSPSSLSRALMSCQQTLTTIEFNSKRGNFDGSSLHLSQLKNVRHLKTSSLLLFEDDEQEDPALRKGLYARLPPSLESLEILFAPDAYAFKSLEDAEEYSDDEALNAEIKVDNLIWLSELAQYRHGLSYVRIEEDAGRSPSMRAHETACLHDVPPRIKEPFDVARIELDLYLRPSFYPSLERHTRECPQ